MVFLNFFEFFCIIFGIFYYALGRNETERKYLFSFLLGLFHPIQALNEVIIIFFNFFQFLYYFFGLFYYALDWNETERKYLSSFFLGLVHRILALNEVIMIFINFLNFSAISLEFSITRQVGTERNYNFYFLSFSSSFNRFWLEMKP